MSKYLTLWQFIGDSGEEKITISFDKIKEICGISIDHSFLTFKKELLTYGYSVEKISLKKQEISFVKIN